MSRRAAQARLRHVIERVLPEFGPHEDAMLTDNWHLAHTMLSPALNVGLLLPGEVCDATEAAYRDGRVPIASAEGFIRQVIGWREYVWGVYWRWMPDYRTRNKLGNSRRLPPVFRGEASTDIDAGGRGPAAPRPRRAVGIERIINRGCRASWSPRHPRSIARR